MRDMRVAFRGILAIPDIWVRNLFRTAVTNLLDPKRATLRVLNHLKGDQFAALLRYQFFS